MPEQLPVAPGVISPELAQSAHTSATGDQSPQPGCIVGGAAVAAGVETPTLPTDPLAGKLYPGEEQPETD